MAAYLFSSRSSLLADILSAHLLLFAALSFGFALYDAIDGLGVGVVGSVPECQNFGFRHLEHAKF